MTILKHKGYHGTASVENGKIVIEVLDLSDLITTECDRADEVEGKFRELVDDYLEVCAAIGRTPDRPYKGQFNVRVSPELHKNAAIAATARRVSLNKIVEEALQEFLREKEPLPNLQKVYGDLDRYHSLILNKMEALRRNKSLWDSIDYGNYHANLVPLHHVSYDELENKESWLDLVEPYWHGSKKALVSG